MPDEDEHQNPDRQTSGQASEEGSTSMLPPESGEPLNQPMDCLFGVDELAVRVVNYVPTSLYEQPVFWSALLALGMSGFSIYLSLTLPRKARLQSMHDEFWIRTVLYPKVIEPTTAFVEEVVNTLPHAALLPDREVRKLIDEFSRAHRQVMTKAITAHAVEKAVYDEIKAALEGFEELVQEFLGSLDCTATPPAEMTEIAVHRAAVNDAAQDVIAKMMHSIRARQGRINT